MSALKDKFGKEIQCSICDCKNKAFEIRSAMSGHTSYYCALHASPYGEITKKHHVKSNEGKIQFKIGNKVKDSDGSICVVSDLTSSSIELTIPAKSKKGIEAKNWFGYFDSYDKNTFNKRFKLISQ